MVEIVWPPPGVEWPDDSAMRIESGQALERFCPGEVKIGRNTYHLLTGFEDRAGCCFWCGEKLKGKLKRYCYGHMTQYYDCFNWGYASAEALKRASCRCENCGFEPGPYHVGNRGLEVHHIVPLKGQARFFSAWNIPWNLIALCHQCHQVVHAIMRLPRAERLLDPWEAAKQTGQSLMAMSYG